MSGSPISASNASAIASQVPEFSATPSASGTSEPAVISTQSGQKLLDSHVADHTQDMQNIGTSNPVYDTKTGALTTYGQQIGAKDVNGTSGNTSKVSEATVTAIKAQGGVTADEANASGINVNDPNAYTYDTNSGYFLPKTAPNPADAINATYQKQADNATDTFNGMMSNFNSAEQAIVQGLQNDYAGRVQDQMDINAHQLAGTNTMNIRNGTSRYAGGVAGSIFTAEENYGLQKINDIKNQLQSAIADADQKLQDKQYTAFVDQRNYIEKLNADKSAALQNLQDEADKQKQYQLDVQKFQETKDQSAFDNAFKVEQERFAETKANTAEAETERHNQATESIDAFKAGMGAGSNAGGIGNGITSAQMSASGGVDPVSQKMTYDQISQTYGPMTAVAVQGLVDYSRLPSDWKPGASKGMTRDQAVTLAQMLDPTYTEAGAPARQAYMKSLASVSAGSIGAGVNAANKSINHLTSFVTSIGTLGNGISSNINAFDNALTLNQTQRQNITATQTEGLGVASELAKFFKGTGASDQTEVDAWKAKLSSNASPADVKGLVQGAVNLLSGQLDTLSQQYQSTMGKAPESNFLNPSAMANLSALKNQGYEVNIKGVYYTDPTAYLKADPANADKLQEVRTANPDLTPAQAIQLAQFQQENGQ